jgi:hypothetical protein
VRGDDGEKRVKGEMMMRWQRWRGGGGGDSDKRGCAVKEWSRGEDEKETRRRREPVVEGTGSADDRSRGEIKTCRRRRRSE